MTGSPPDVVHWTPRSNDHGDCAVVIIAMATGFTYEETLAAAVSIRPEVLHLGLTLAQTRKTLQMLGYKVRASSKFDLSEDTGLLWVEAKGDAHMVYLWGGRIINPAQFDRTALWMDPTDYLKAGGWTAKWLVTFKEV